MNAEEFRRLAMQRGLDLEDLNTDPILQFEQWFEHTNAAGIPEPNAMSLATVAAHGQPSLRTVLLKVFDRHGFVFFTNFSSRKAQDIDHNPKVALLFPWVALGRQVKIIGNASRIPLAESAKYFATRSRGSQIGAWASYQSKVISTRALLEAKFDEMKRNFAQGRIALPSFWGGYRVVPHSIEFWQGRENRLHDRFQYTRTDSGEWKIERLAP